MSNQTQKKSRKELDNIKKLTTRMPADLFDKFKKAAVDKHRSMSQLITQLVKEFLQRK